MGGTESAGNSVCNFPTPIAMERESGQKNSPYATIQTLVIQLVCQFELVSAMDAAPPNSTLFPPTHYMLFVLNKYNVPSIGKFVFIDGSEGVGGVGHR